MDAFLEAVLCLLWLVLAWRSAVRRARSRPSLIEFFALQLLIFVAVAVVVFACLVSLWLGASWWLNLPVRTAVVYLASMVAWLAVSGLAAFLRGPASTGETHRKPPVWVFPALPLTSLLLLASVWVAFLVSWKMPPPVAAGRITADLTYEVDSVTYGFGAHGFEYSVYRTPRWFGLVHRTVANALFQPVPNTCSLDAELPGEFIQGSVQFRPGPNDRTIWLTCINTRSQGPVSSTVLVPLR